MKSVRRKQTVDDAYFEKLYDDTISLYRLDQGDMGETVSGGRQKLGALPRTSVTLLSALAGAWVLILSYVGISAMRERRKNRESTK